MNDSVNKKIGLVSIFLVIILIICIYLYPVLKTSFLSNVYINSTIILSLIFGLIYTIYNIVNLENDLIILKKFSKKTNAIKYNILKTHTLFQYLHLVFEILNYWIRFQ